MKTLLLLPLLALTGCATNDYALYADTAAKTEIARYNADAAKYRAMSDIAVSGTEAAKVAAVMAMTLGQDSAAHAARLQAPQASQALQWAQVLVPGLTQIAGIAANARVAQVQSNNAARTAESTNSTFGGIAANIKASNVSTVTTTDRHDSVAPITTIAPTPVVVTPVVQVVPTVAPTVVPTVITPVIPIVPIVVTAPLVDKSAAQGK